MSNNGPSNIRINPFTGDGGATTYVNLTETHIIPSVSPFVIRLNEVPEKRDPSNIKAVWVDSNTGDVTSNALTEVAATPSAGEFRPDYSTKADGNEAWNTGLIEFNSADAGKIVQITYTGMGTLAAVQSNKYPSWYTDRGDGSDGDFVPTENATISDVKNFKNVIIKEGVTVTASGELIMKVQGIVKISGVLDASGGNGANGKSSGAGGTGGGTGGHGGAQNENGKTGEAGTGGGAGGAGQPRIGGESGSYGGNGGPGGKSGGTIGLQYGGSGAGGGGGGGSDRGGYYGAGGGGGGKLIAIIAKCINISSTGKISTVGGKGGNGAGRYTTSGGGGGGGDVSLIANYILNDGTVDCSGGDGGNGAAKGQDGTKVIKQLGVL